MDKTIVHKISLSDLDDSGIYAFGIFSHETVFRLAWLLNRAFQLEFKLIDPVSIFDKKLQKQLEFNQLFYHNLEDDITYELVSNLQERTILYPNLKAYNYIFKITTSDDFFDHQEILKALKKISEVILVAFCDSAELNIIKKK